MAESKGFELRGFKTQFKDPSKLVHDYIIQEGAPPPAIKDDLGGNVENIERMMGSLSSMTAVCMHN
jgi:hypothetical protein